MFHSSQPIAKENHVMDIKTKEPNPSVALKYSNCFRVKTLQRPWKKSGILQDVTDKISGARLSTTSALEFV